MNQQGPPTLEDVLTSAARLQEVVPDAVLVGGTAAAFHARHRLSFAHDHVVADLAARYEDILDAVEATDGWITSVRASSPPMTLLGSLGGIEAGLRQLRRSRPLEVEEAEVAQGHTVRIPTLPEILRVKSYLVVQRNQTRDYLDTVALADRLPESAAVTLANIDDYYTDRSGEADAVVTALVQRLAEPAPRDSRATRQLERYKGLTRRWTAWSDVVAASQDLAAQIVRAREER